MCKVFNNLFILGLFALLLNACMGTATKTQPLVSSDMGKVLNVTSGQKKVFKNALELMQEGKYQEASLILEGLVLENQNLVGPYINLGISYTELKEYEKAEGALLKALKLNTQNIVAHNRLGLAYRRMGRFSDAKIAYERALQIDPEYAFGHRNLGILCDIYMQDLECALQHFEKYQSMSDGADTNVEIWVADLKQRINKASREAHGE